MHTRIVLVLVVSQLSACAVLSKLGVPVSSAPAAVSSAPPTARPGPSGWAAPPKVVVPPEGVVVRLDRGPAPSDAWKLRESALAEFELSAPVAGWVFEAHLYEPSWKFAIEPADAPATAAPAREWTRALDRVDLGPGRYRVLVRWDADAPPRRFTISFHPPKVDPLLHAEATGEVPLESRRLDLWFPFARSRAATRELSDAEILAAAPKWLFVYAQDSSAELENQATSSEWGEGAPTSNRTQLVAGEPLVRYGSPELYLASDLSRVLHPAKPVVAQPPAAVAFPSVRTQWKQLPQLLAEVGDPKLKSEGEKFLSEWSAARQCELNAAGWLSVNTTNVILTPKARSDLSKRHDAMRATCKLPEVYTARRTLAAKVLDAWRVEKQQQVVAVQAELSKKFN